jgi:hypothetical protein
MQYLGLDSAVLDEPSSKVAPTRLGHLQESSALPTALAAWLLDRHGDAAGNALEVARRWSTALMLSNEERFAFTRCLEIFSTLMEGWASLGVAGQKRLAASEHFTDALALVQATDRQMFVDLRRRVYELSQTGLAPPALLDGEDLIRLGFRPGPLFSRLLSAVYDAQLEGSVTTTEQAVALARVLGATSA